MRLWRSDFGWSRGGRGGHRVWNCAEGSPVQGTATHDCVMRSLTLSSVDTYLTAIVFPKLYRRGKGRNGGSAVRPVEIVR